jgi:hypothetical protein
MYYIYYDKDYIDSIYYIVMISFVDIYGEFIIEGYL